MVRFEYVLQRCLLRPAIPRIVWICGCAACCFGEDLSVVDGLLQSATNQVLMTPAAGLAG
jgi:hypothetical protein